MVLVLAGVFLFEDAEGASVDLMAVLPLAVVMFVAAVVAGRIAHRTRHQPSVSTGGDSLRGRAVQVGAVRGDTGRVFADGAWWSVRSAAGPLREGEAVRVVELDGLTLVVEPMEPDPAEDRGPGRTAYDTGKDAP